MTAKEWVMKFGVRWDPDNADIYDKDDNQVQIMDGNLEDMACECGQRDQFRIEVAVVADVDDCHIEPDKPDYSSFNNDSYCRCCSCQEDGDVSDFKIEGLDALLRTIYNDEITEPKFDAEPEPPPIPLNSLPFNKVSESETQPPQSIGWDTSNIKQ